MKRLKYIVLLIVFIMCNTVFASEIPEVTENIAIKTDKPVGLRIKAVLDIQTAESVEATEYGFIVVRKVFLTSKGKTQEEFTLDCGVPYIKGISKGVSDGMQVNKFFEKNDYNLYFTGYIHGIPENYYTEIIVSRPYIIKGNTAFYGEPVETSIYDVAKAVKADTEAFNSLTQEQKNVIDSIIVSVDGEPYEIAQEDLRIVLSSRLVKNLNPTYSVCYDLFNPYTGETHTAVMGRKKSRNPEDITQMLVPSGVVVPMYDGIVQDTTEGYIAVDFNKKIPLWIGSLSLKDGIISVAEHDETLECKECIRQYISRNSVNVSLEQNTPVYVFDGNFEKAEFSLSNTEKVSTKDTSLLCYNTSGSEIVYADYVKAYASVNSNGICEYILVVVNDSGNGVIDEECSLHDECTVTFFCGEKVYTTEIVDFGAYASIPEEPEVDKWDKFCGWALTKTDDKSQVVNLEEFQIREDTDFYAVIIINPNSDVLMSRLTEGCTQLSGITRFPNTKAKDATNIIKDCIGYVLEDAGNGIFVDKDYVKRVYGTKIDEVKYIINNEMTESQRSSYYTFITSIVSKEVQEFMRDYFDFKMTL